MCYNLNITPVVNANLYAYSIMYYHNSCYNDIICSRYVLLYRFAVAAQVVYGWILRHPNELSSRVTPISDRSVRVIYGRRGLNSYNNNDNMYYARAFGSYTTFGNLCTLSLHAVRDWSLSSLRTSVRRSRTYYFYTTR